MSITELSIVDQTLVDANGCVSVRRADKVYRDGVEIASTYHRHVLEPGADLTGQDPKVVAIANVMWTPDVIAAYAVTKAAELARMQAMFPPAS